jgi:copper chaperone CopZ
MKLTSNILVAITVLLSFTSCDAQIKNAKTETVKIYGNCGMCEKTIEKAGNLKDIAKIDWNVDTKMATITYDTKKTNQDEILKRIALSGYDSDKFLAPDDVYNNLHGCCQYDRVAKIPVNTNVNTESQTNYEKQTETPKAEIQDLNQLKVVFENYFALKDELVKTDGNTASAKAATLLLTINRVEMQTLKTEEHNVWMKIVKNIKEDSEHIADTKDIKHQRDHFVTLSKNIYDLIKVSKQETPTYYQFCPMANNGKGANWLSKENTVKNPYYGSMMLNCGKVIETIK